MIHQLQTIEDFKLIKDYLQLAYPIALENAELRAPPLAHQNLGQFSCAKMGLLMEHLTIRPFFDTSQFMLNALG